MQKEMLEQINNLYKQLIDYAKERDFNLEIDVDGVIQKSTEFGHELKIEKITIKSLSKKPYKPEPIMFDFENESKTSKVKKDGTK